MANEKRSSDKIQDLETLAGTIAALKKQGKRVVQCHGVFDLLHVGHIRHFEAARKFGDVLVVTLTPDQFVNKGPNRPAFPHLIRAEVLAQLQCVDYVAVNRWPQATEAIRLLKPSFYCKGSDYKDAAKDVTGGIKLEQDAVESVGGQLVFTDEITSSSSSLINRHMATYPKPMADFLQTFTQDHSAEQMNGYLEAAKKLKVLVLGEAIIDEYHYCETLGKSGKEPILAVRFRNAEKFAGGIMAVANHVASFADRVDMVTFLGNQDTQEAFIRERLDPKVKPTFFYMDGAPTITKRRYIESYPFQKMFEVYFMNEDESEKANTAKFIAWLEQHLAEYDLVIVTDYGHGMIGHEAVEVLCRKAKCLAVNTQTNADNHGFNTVSKYPRADYVCVSEKELRLETRKRRDDIHHVMELAAERTAAQRVMVTQGRQGLLCYSRGQGFARVPAFTEHFTDRVGAGDAVFAVTSLCMAQGAGGDVLAFVGNTVGAMAVTIVGNRQAIDRAALMKFITSLLK